MRNKNYDLIIVGGGASGLAAAISAKKYTPHLRVAILERNDIFGKKLRATGNGRGNLSNIYIPGYQDTIDFFYDIGILTRADRSGRIYPFSESAGELTDHMIHQAVILGCDLFAYNLVEKISKTEHEFRIQSSKDNFSCQKLILAMGGKAGISSSDKQKMTSCDGYTFAKAMGHTVTKTTPVLTGVQIDEMPKSLAGIRVKGEVRLLIDNDVEPIFAEKGEIQFTEYGLSGICVFNLSRYLKYVGTQKLAPYTIEIDLDPERCGEGFVLDSSTHSFVSHHSVMHILSGMLKQNLAKVILNRSGIDGQKVFGTLTEENRRSLYQHICALGFKPKGTMGFQMAQCTSGGVAMEELDPENGASRLVPGLYITGELMDYDGPCGGYNLDHAFRTGMLAGKDVALDLQSEALS